MTRPEQTERERAWVSEALTLLGISSERAPVAHAPPLPDFELELADGRRVGVEVTEARDADYAKAWEGTRSRLQSLTGDLLRRADASAQVIAYAHVEDLIAMHSGRRAVASAAERLAAFAGATLPRTLETRGSKHAGLDFLQGIRIQPSPRPDVLIVSSGMPRGPGLIEAAIAAKSDKLDGYRELGADAYWLLVVGGATISGYVTQDDAAGRRFRSTFDRVLLLVDGVCADVAVEPEPRADRAT